jgi:replicative DNA helicase
VEQRADGRPKLSDLRSSGQIEQDADLVMMLHKADDQTTELIIEKNRHGRTGSVWLAPRFEYMRFAPGKEPVRIEEQPKKRGMQF